MLTSIQASFASLLPYFTTIVRMNYHKGVSKQFSDAFTQKMNRIVVHLHHNIPVVFPCNRLHVPSIPFAFIVTLGIVLHNTIYETLFLAFPALLGLPDKKLRQ